MSTATTRIRRAAFEALEGRALFAAAPYLVPSAGGVTTTPLLTVGDARPETGNPAGSYRMAGIPDGLGAYDNNDGTFTVLMNHELGSTVGTVRDHGQKGAFVSKWVVDKSTLAVLSGDDLIKTVFAWDAAAAKYVLTPTAFQRFCSATLAEPTAFYDPATGLGTQERIYANGEENALGRAWAHVVSTGQTFELPWMGKYAFENVSPNPLAQKRTVVVGTDDSSRLFAGEGATDPSEVYVYVGEKKSGTGNPVADAGLTGGSLFGVKVTGAANESAVAGGARFTLAGLGDVSAKSAAQLQADSVAAGVTQFRRVEDGAWDPANPNDFYYTTTDQFGGNTRVWKLSFDDASAPEAGGTIAPVIDSPPGVPGEMFDNLTVDADNHLLVQEDTGNQPYVGKVWQKDLATGDLVEVVHHEPSLFDPNYAGFGVAGPNFLTQDEESSGIIDLSGILGPGHYLADVQAHYKIDAANNRFQFPNPDELVEGGQLLVINTNAATAALDPQTGALTVTGTINDDRLFARKLGANVVVTANGRTIGSYPYALVRSLVVEAGAGGDDVSIDALIDRPTLIRGGLGDDRLYGGGGRNVIVGEEGKDTLFGRGKDDLLVGNKTTLTTAGLRNVLGTWSGGLSYAQRANAVRPVLAPTLGNDSKADRLTGAGGRDWFYKGPGDLLVDLKADELVN